MDIAALEALTQVAEHGSFSVAARQLHLSQPAVSKRISGLEAELGVALFHRLGRSIQITDAGRALLPYARRALAELRNARLAVERTAEHISGPVTLGTSHHVGLHRLPPILREINRRFPQVVLDLRFMESEASLQAVERGELDLAVVTLPVSKPASLETRVIWVDPMLAVAAPEHPLAGMASLTPESLSAYPAVLPHTGSHTRELIDRTLQSAGIRPPVPFCTNFLETNRMMVAVGLAWSVLPRTMINSQIRPLPVEDLHVTRHLGVIRHRRREQGGAAGALLKLLAGYSDTASFRDQS